MDHIYPTAQSPLVYAYLRRYCGPPNLCPRLEINQLLNDAFCFHGKSISPMLRNVKLLVDFHSDSGMIFLILNSSGINQCHRPYVTSGTNNITADIMRSTVPDIRGTTAGRTPAAAAKTPRIKISRITRRRV